MAGVHHSKKRLFDMYDISFIFLHALLPVFFPFLFTYLMGTGRLRERKTPPPRRAVQSARLGEEPTDRGSKVEKEGGMGAGRQEKQRRPSESLFTNPL